MICQLLALQLDPNRRDGGEMEDGRGGEGKREKAGQGEGSEAGNEGGREGRRELGEAEEGRAG